MGFRFTFLPFPMKGARIWGTILVATSILVGSAQGQELSLDVSTRVKYDDDGEGSDWDSTIYSNLTITDLIKNRLDLKISGWGLWDMDANDAFDNALEGKNIRISEAYVDLRNLGVLSRLRLGRQYLRDTDWMRLDGASAMFREGKEISFFAFAGREVSYYQSARDDWAGGGGVIWKPSWKTKHQLDAYAAHENDDYFFAYAWRWNQYWGKQLRTTSRLRFLDSEMRDYRAHLTKYFESVGIGMDLDYYFQPERRGYDDEARTRSFSALGRVLGPRAANHRFSASVNKFFGEKWMVELGGSVRRRLEEEERPDYNSFDSESAHLSVTRFNNFIENLDLTLSGEYINNEQDRLWTVTGQASYRIGKKWDFGLGVSYSRYRFDPMDFNTEHFDQDDVDLFIEDLRMPVYFAEARWKPSKKFDVRGEISYQDMDELYGNGFGARLTLNYHLRKSLTPAEDWSAPESEAKPTDEKSEEKQEGAP